jgi:hypothetical protein
VLALTKLNVPFLLNRWPLRLGYYILKNPSQSQLGMEFDAARAAEAIYFATSHPWSGLASGYASRFGRSRCRAKIYAYWTQLACCIKEKPVVLIKRSLAQLSGLGLEREKQDPVAAEKQTRRTVCFLKLTGLFIAINDCSHIIYLLCCSSPVPCAYHMPLKQHIFRCFVTCSPC